MIARKFCLTFFPFEYLSPVCYRDLQLYYKYLGTVLGDFGIYLLQ